MRNWSGIGIVLGISAAISGCEWLDSVPTAKHGAAHEQSPHSTVASLQHGFALRGSVVQSDRAFQPGDPVHLAVDVSHTRTPTVVAVHWYGPDGQSLGHAMQHVEKGEDLVTFTRRSTLQWVSGEYRAAVWIGDRKVSEQRVLFAGEQPRTPRVHAAQPERLSEAARLAGGLSFLGVWAAMLLAIAASGAARGQLR
jgi:hypothetical protein